MVLSGGKDIDLPHLPPGMAGATTPDTGTPAQDASGVRPLHEALRAFEHEYLQRALKTSGGKRSQTAAMLGISRKTLWEKLRAVDPAVAGTPEPEDSELS